MDSSRLGFERLETRNVPAAFGNSWAAPETLTISFAPDGTSVEGVNSSLAQLATNSGLSVTAVKTEILRAFQTWADAANLNFIVVADEGQAYGTTGDIQGDDRFGDIRIFARSLSWNNYAVSSPPDEIAGTRSGDIILNSDKIFAINSMMGTDLYTVMLQEAGHALGVGNSGNMTSAMYEYYSGAKTGISTGDVNEIRSLYGVRRDWVGDAPGVFGDATPIPIPTGTTIVTHGDISGASDVDFYRVTIPDTDTTSVRLETSDLSLLAAKITILSSIGTEVVSTSATTPGGNLELTFEAEEAGDEYVIKVERDAMTSFGTGHYRLRIGSETATNEQLDFSAVSIRDDEGTDDSIEDAFTLTAIALDNDRTRVNAALADSTDKDVYRIVTSSLATGETGELTISLRNFNAGALPTLAVFDANGNAVATETVFTEDGQTAVRLVNATGSTTYHIQVGDGALDNAATYQLSTAFRSIAPSLTLLQAGALTPTTGVNTSMNVLYSTGMYLVLTGANGTSTDSVTLTIRDMMGTSVFSLTAANGTASDGYAFLMPGYYTVQITSTGPIEFALGGASLTDPEGVTPIDPLTNPSGNVGTTVPGGTPPPSSPPIQTLPTYSYPLPPGGDPMSPPPFIDPQLTFPDPLLLLPYPTKIPVITPGFMMMIAF